MLHIYYGLGKGKTSTLNGSAIRAQGANMKVAYFRFLKGRKTNEDSQLEKLGISVVALHPSEKFVMQMTPEEVFSARNAAKSMMSFILMNKHRYDMIILDEFLDLAAHNVNFFTETDLLDFLDKLKDKEVLVSGHTKLERVFAAADLITHYHPEKHYFEKGVKAREGIEY